MNAIPNLSYLIRASIINALKDVSYYKDKEFDFRVFIYDRTDLPKCPHAITIEMVEKFNDQ